MIKVWYCTIDNGDGSYQPVIFPTEEEARAREQYEIENYGLTVCDAVDFMVIHPEDFEEI